MDGSSVISRNSEKIIFTNNSKLEKMWKAVTDNGLNGNDTQKKNKILKKYDEIQNCANLDRIESLKEKKSLYASVDSFSEYFPLFICLSFH